MSNPEPSINKIPFGTILKNRYLIKKVLGQGGLGRTYLAADTHRFDEPCVLKEFAPVGARKYDLDKSRELFIRESKILHQLTHPQIPKFLACFEDRGRLFLIQEYIKGKTYSTLLKTRKKNQKTFSESEIIKFLTNLLPVLDYIHRQNVLHRDISPDNIMQPEGKLSPVLIDFGVGKLTSDSVSMNNTDSYIGQMSFVGKIGYAPREQVTMGICSPSSDLYSLGVTAIVLLTGKDPTLLLDRYSLQWRWTPYAQVSPAFKTILDKMTEEIPRERYQSSQEVLRDIERNIINCETFINPLNKNSVERSPAKSQKNSRSEETVIISDVGVEPLNSQPSRKPPSEETVIISDVSVEPLNSQPSRKPPSEETVIISNVSVEPLNSQPSRKPPSEETVIISNVGVEPLNSQPSKKSSSEETVIMSNVGVEPLNSQPQPKNRTSRPKNQDSSTKTQLFDVDNSDHQSSSSSSKVNRPKPSTEETMIISNASSTPLPPSSPTPDKLPSYSTQLNTSSRQKRTLKPQFVKLCRHHLVEYMGDMADTIVDEILIQNMPKTPQALVDAIASKIPNSYQAQQFKQKLWEQ